MREVFGRVGSKTRRRAFRCKSSLVPRCGLSAAIAHAVPRTTIASNALCRKTENAAVGGFTLFFT